MRTKKDIEREIRDSFKVVNKGGHPMINYQPYAIRENGNELYIPDIQENEYNYFIERLNDNDRELIKELTNAGFDISKIKTTSKDRSDFTSELNLAFDWYWDEHSEEIIENELDELEYR